MLSAFCTQIAARNNHSEVIRALIEGGANVQERNATTQWVALHEAAFRGNVKACEMLLFGNAPVQPRTLDGELPRGLAQRYGKTEVMKLLGKLRSQGVGMNLMSILLCIRSLSNEIVRDVLSLGSFSAVIRNLAQF